VVQREQSSDPVMSLGERIDLMAKQICGIESRLSSLEQAMQERLALEKRNNELLQQLLLREEQKMKST
jgi:hypothetical protein